MKRWRLGFAVLGALVASASCASLLGIQDPDTIGHGGQIGASSVSVGGGAASGGAPSTGGNGGTRDVGGTGGSAVTSATGTNTGGFGAGGGAGCPTGEVQCNGPSSPCVDKTRDHGNCGACNSPCPAAYACILAGCVPQFAKTQDYSAQLAMAQGDFIASGLSLNESGAKLALGGILSGKAFVDGTSVPAPDPFVWITDTTTPATVGYESACHLNTNCGSATAQQTRSVAFAAAFVQLVSTSEIATFDASLGGASLDVAHSGTDIGLVAGTPNNMLAMADPKQVSLGTLTNGVVTSVPHPWPLPISPQSPAPVLVSAVAGTFVVAGALAGPGTPTVGTKTGTTHGMTDAFVAVFDEMGVNNSLFIFSPPAQKNARVTAVSFSGSDIYVAGVYEEALTIGSCPTVHAVNQPTQMFAARLDGAGACIWATTFGSLDGIDTPTAIVDIGGPAIVGATTAHSANFGGQDLVVPSPLFLLLLDEGTGQHVYSWAWGQGTSGQPVALATDGTDLWIGGYYSGGQISDLLPMPPAQSIDASYVIHFPASQF